MAVDIMQAVNPGVIPTEEDAAVVETPAAKTAATAKTGLPAQKKPAQRKIAAAPAPEPEVEPEPEPEPEVQAETAEEQAGLDEESEPVAEAKPARIRVKDREYALEELEKELETKTYLESKRKSLDAAAFKWAEERSALKKELDALKERGKSDPLGQLNSLGANFDELALKRVQELADMHQMTPEQRAYADGQNHLKSEREKLAAERAEIEESQNKARSGAFQQRIVPAITKAIEANHLPDHPIVGLLLKTIGQYQMEAEGRDFPDLDYLGLEVGAQIDEVTDARLASLPPEALAAKMSAHDQRLGSLSIEVLSKKFPSLLKKLRTHDVASASRGPARQVGSQIANVAPRVRPSAPERGEKSYASVKDWWNEANRRAGGST